MRNNLTVWLIFAVFGVLFTACKPEAKWETEDVTIQMNVQTVSAGFAECSFSTNKEAYYLVAIQPAEEGFDPMKNQKQFMMLALDSANSVYLNWRYWQLKEGEFNIASFASHSLQYGETEHVFTNLIPDTDYWIYAFVVNPETLKPVGRLSLTTIRTAIISTYDVHFDYRVRGQWDYIYPIDASGHIDNRFPYMAATRDSVFLAEYMKQSPEDFFTTLFVNYALYDIKEAVLYGVHVVKNDGLNSEEIFQVGHTYYTAIVSFDGFMGNNVIYKFTWTGEDCDLYMTEKDNIITYDEEEKTEVGRRSEDDRPV